MEAYVGLRANAQETSDSVAKPMLQPASRYIVLSWRDNLVVGRDRRKRSLRNGRKP